MFALTTIFEIFLESFHLQEFIYIYCFNIITTFLKNYYFVESVKQLIILLLFLSI